MNIYSLATLGIMAMTLGNVSVPLDSNSYQEEAVKNSRAETRANITISTYRVENVTDEGFDFIIKFDSDSEVTGLTLPYWKNGNYGGRKNHTNVEKIGTNEFKAHIKMKDIGSGTEYVYVGIHPITSQGQVFLTDLTLKLDTTNPNLNTSLSNSNWTNKNININSSASDDMNIIENYYFYDKNNNQTKENVYSNPNILMIVGYNNSSAIRDSVVNRYDNLTVVNQTDLTSINQLKGYDVVIYDGHFWSINDDLANILNEAFEEGISIITNFNDGYKNLSIGGGTDTAIQTFGTYTFKNNVVGGGYFNGRLNRFASLMEGLSEGDSDGYYKIIAGEDTFVISTATHNDGTSTPAVLMKTHSNGNKWIHFETAYTSVTSGALYRAIDEIMCGTMKTRQTYSKSYEVSENGTYYVEVEDFSGNKTKKAVVVSNIDKVAPTMTITGNPTSWAKSATLVVTGSDDLSGIKEIVLPDGNVVKSNTASFTTTKNGDYTFKIVDNAGNEYSKTVTVNKVDTTIDDVLSMKATMSHLNADSSSRKLTVTFPSISDNQSGIKGYSYVIDKNSNTEPDNTVDTTSTTIEKEISDTGKYYFHIKAIDNAGNVSYTKHFEIEIPKLITELNENGTLDLVWDMETTEQPFLYNVLRKRYDETEYSEVKTSELRDRVNILNIHPNVGATITYTTWDGETITTTQSGQLKKWMEEPNSENEKGYGMGIIEVIPITQDEFNANPQTYLYKATSGANKGKYVTNIRGVEEVVDVVMFGTWDSNGSKDISNTGVQVIKAFLDDKGSVLFGHDTLHYSRNFWQFASYADVKKQNPIVSSETGTTVIVGGTHIQANREGLITQYPWNIGTDELIVPATHTSFQMVNDKNTWIRFSRPSDDIIPSGLASAGWVERLIQYDGYSNDAYLALNGNVGQIQTGHSNANATPDEQKVLANTLFYLSQLSTISETTITDNLALDVDNPTIPTITTHEFLNNGNKIKFNFTKSTDNGTEYSYYVKANGQDDNAVRLSNTVEHKITSGLKGYSYVVDNKSNTVPDNVVDTTETTVTVDNNIGNKLYLHVKAIDNAGNVSEVSHYLLEDSTNPTLSITGNLTAWTNKDVVLNITATDTGSGIKEIILPNGNKVTSSSTSYTVSSNGSYTFKVIDNMGNETSQTVVVNKIDKLISNISNVYSNMEMLDTETSKRKIVFTLNPISETGQSGFKGYSYVIDNNPTTIPDDNIETTSTTIEKEITDTEVYYLHIKAIDNAGNISNIIHHKVDIPNLNATVNSKDNNIRLDWTMNDINNKTFKVYQKKPGSNEFQTVSATNFNDSKQVKVLNIHPNMGTTETFSTWDGETLELPKSALLKRWMEEPNSENSKGYGKGLIEVTAVSIEDFNANPNYYLTQDNNGTWNYDVVMIGSYDSNGRKDIDNNATSLIINFISNGGGILFGHDTIAGLAEMPNLRSLSSYLNMKFSGGAYFNGINAQGGVASGISKITVTKKGSLTNYPWEIGDVGTDLSVPSTHTSGQIANGDIWMRFNYENTNMNHSGNYYLTTWNNTAMIQTGHSNGSATPDEQKLLANTLFYLNQLSSDNFLEDNSGQDVTAPNTPKIYEHKFTEDGYVEVNFNEVVDNGSEYSYYVESQTKDKDSLTLSNVVTETITSGLKGYSFVIDSNADTIPDDIIETTTAKTIKVKNNSDNLYVHIKAIDNVGNSSETLHYKISDVTKPTLELSLTPTSLTNGNVTINAKATDSESGVKEIILPNGNVINSTTASYTVSANGVYYFKAIDYMGNETTSSIKVSNIDKNKPTVTIQNNTNWTNQDVQVIITATDE